MGPDDPLFPALPHTVALRGMDDDLSTLDEEGLCDLLHVLDDHKQAIRARQLAVHAQIEVVRARRQVLALPESERRALAQAIDLVGIPSAEAVG